MKSINFEHLSQMQRKIDELIKNSKKIDDSLEIYEKKTLALIVEICELANEIRSFKYWSLNKNINTDKCLEEYIDCLHFLLSIGNDLKISFKKIMINFQIEHKNKNLTHLFLLLINKIIFLQKNKNPELFVEIFNIFWSIGQKLEFSYSDIYSKYLYKHEINIARQANEY